MNASRKTFIVCAAVVVAAACGTKEADDPLSPSGQQGRIRFVNLITDPARNPVNVTLENLPFGVNLAYATSTPATLPAPATANYSPVLAGARQLAVQRTANTTVTVANASLTITAGQDHTVLATGGSAGGAVSITTFGSGDGPVTGQVRIRFINASPGAVDVFVTAANADLAAATPSATNVSTNGFSTGVTVAPGTYQIRTVPAGTAAAARAAAVNTTLTGLTVAAGGVRTIFFAPSATGGTPLQSFALTYY